MRHLVVVVACMAAWAAPAAAEEVAGAAETSVATGVSRSRALPPDSAAATRATVSPIAAAAVVPVAPASSAPGSTASPAATFHVVSASVAAPVTAERAGMRRTARSPADPSVRCVAMAVFHEARGEPLRGQRAVADVVMNRARSGRWGSSACSVVDAPFQFSNRRRWSLPVAGVAAWDRAVDIARDAVSGAVGVSSRLMNFRAARLGVRGALRIGAHAFW